MVTKRDRKSFEWRQQIPNIAQRTGIFDVFDPRSGTSGPLLGDRPHVQIFMNDGPNPLTEYAQSVSFELCEIRRSSKNNS